MAMNENWIISVEESGMRLQAFLKSKLNSCISARQIKQFVDAGCCHINGKVEKFSTRLVGKGDRIVFCRPDAPALMLSSLDALSRVLYTDDELIIYDKPSGVISEDKHLLAFIKQHCMKDGSESVQLVHRLDRDTTGILIFAKNKIAAEAMFSLFKQRQIKKTYLAIVDGVPKDAQGIVDNFLGKIVLYQGQTLYGETSKEMGGLWARTAWERKKTGEDAALIACYPETGRTHQLRVHLSGLGHPILGDHQYGHSFICSYRPQRMLLHAHAIAFENPVTKQPVKVVAKLPADFAEAETFLIKLKRPI